MADSGRGRLRSGDREQHSLLRVHGDYARFVSEERRMLRAFEVSLVSGLFRVPRILARDGIERTLTIEYIPCFVALGRLGVRGSALREVVERLGRAMASIHNATWIADDGSEAPLFHGDPDPFNIGLDEKGRLALVDWDPAPGLDRLGLSPRDKDIGLIQFYLVTALSRPPRTLLAVDEVIAAFLDGYRAERALDASSAFAAANSVGRVLCEWTNVPKAPRLRRAYYWALRRASLKRLRRIHPGASGPVAGGGL